MILLDLGERRKALEAACNPKGENLHFGPQVLTSPVVLEDLYDIGMRAWQAVEDHQSWQAAFWFYDWFLLVANVCLQTWRDNTQQDYSDIPVAKLLPTFLRKIDRMRG